VTPRLGNGKEIGEKKNVTARQDVGIRGDEGAFKNAAMKKPRRARRLALELWFLS